MSNLKSAEQAIQAELDHARQGLAYYQSKVEALEDALAKVHSVQTVLNEDGNAPVATKTRRSSAAAPKSQGKRRTQPASAGGADKLPSTGKDFWPSLLTDDPQSPAEILSAAIKALGISPSADQTKKLSQRQANALSVMAKSGDISTVGDGRSRRYFRKDSSRAA
ncbi:hypothetical protein [Noviherbaspirillum aerium]|uniref:hypothetical protein n=1 Tax=Noviherbaspirillum aerium TaxID=2588497 RepID=UPI00124F11F5|nr:hypothetical protein [Noviherbaspirillum aerium]